MCLCGQAEPYSSSERLSRASGKVVARLATVPPEQQFTSAITVGEMVYGAYRTPSPEPLLRQLEERVWPNVRVLPFDRHCTPNE